MWKKLAWGDNTLEILTFEIHSQNKNKPILLRVAYQPRLNEADKIEMARKIQVLLANTCTV